MKTVKRRPACSMIEISVRLNRIAADMHKLGCDMDYYGGFWPMAEHGREMIGAARIAKSWVKEIKASSLEPSPTQPASK